MTLCESCGERIEPVPDSVEKGDLVIRRNPPSASWAGRLICTSPTRVRILRALAHRGHISFATLANLPSEADDVLAVMRVQIAYLRRDLKNAGAGISITHTPYGAYELHWSDAP